MRSGEAFTGAPNPATLISATSSQFVLQGGKYWFGATGNFASGTFSLQKVGADGTLQTLGTALTTAGGNVSDYPPGTYQVTVSGSTTASVSWEVVRVNEE